MQATGGKAGDYMRKEKVKYMDDKGEMAGKLVRMHDFLPPADQPVESVTVTLDGEILAFFERERARNKTSYRSIMRKLVRSYTRAVKKDA